MPSANREIFGFRLKVCTLQSHGSSFRLEGLLTILIKMRQIRFAFRQKIFDSRKKALQVF